jgi:hypothetical protein
MTATRLTFDSDYNAAFTVKGLGDPLNAAIEQMVADCGFIAVVRRPECLSWRQHSELVSPRGAPAP